VRLCAGARWRHTVPSDLFAPSRPWWRSRIAGAFAFSTGGRTVVGPPAPATTLVIVAWVGHAPPGDDALIPRNGDTAQLDRVEVAPTHPTPAVIEALVARTYPVKQWGGELPLAGGPTGAKVGAPTPSTPVDRHRFKVSPTAPARPPADPVTAARPGERSEARRSLGATGWQHPSLATLRHGPHLDAPVDEERHSPEMRLPTFLLVLS
jgi:hypothetical protein